MRITEIITESVQPSLLFHGTSIDNAGKILDPEAGRVQNTERERGKIAKFLRSRGWNVLGAGSYAVVAQKNNQVVKFYKKDTPKFKGHTSNPLELVQLAASIQDPAIKQHFPRFGPVRTVKVGNSDWIMIPTEKLSPEPTNIPPFNKDTKLGPRYDPEGDCWDCREDREPFDQKYGPGVWEVFNSHFDAQELVWSKGNADDLDIADNTMYRGWIPVINDPWGFN